MAALTGNFLFVSNIGNQAALPSVFQKAIGKGSEHVAVPFAPVWLASKCCRHCSLGGDICQDIQEVRPRLSRVLI